MGTLGLLKYLPWRRTLFCVRSGGYPTYGFFKYSEHSSFWFMLILMIVVLHMLTNPPSPSGMTSVAVVPDVSAATFDMASTGQYYYARPTTTAAGTYGVSPYYPGSSYDVYTYTPDRRGHGVPLAEVDFNAKLPTADDMLAYAQGAPLSQLGTYAV